MDTEAFAAPDTQAPAVKPEYHTTNQLQALVATATGKPCKSRNRPALLKKLGMAAEGKVGTVADAAGDYDKINKALRHATAPANVSRVVARKVNGKRPGKPKPSKTVDLRAIALKAVTAAMARKNPPSLRALCAELKERKIQKPRGGLDWLPSSVQSLMRQASAAKGK